MKETVSLFAQFPGRVYDLAKQHRVGTPITSHKSTMFYNRLVTASILFLLSVSFLIYTFHNYFIDDPAFTVQATKIVDDCHGCPEYLRAYSSILIYKTFETTRVMIFVGIGLILMNLLQLLIAFLMSKARLYICEEGLLYRSGEAEKMIEAMRWDEVTEVYWLGKNILQLRGTDGQKFNTISGMIGSKKIFEIMEQEVMPRLLCRALEQYKEDGIAWFGNLGVQQAGLGNESGPASCSEDKPIISWAEIEDVHFKKDALGIKVGGKWKYWDEGILEMHRTPNPTVCVALIKHILAMKDQSKS